MGNIGQVNMDKVKKKLAESKAGFGGKFFVLAPGKTLLRVLPPIGGSDIFWIDMDVHTIPHLSSKGKIQYSEHVCIGDGCVVCSRIKKAHKSKDSGLIQHAAALSGKTRSFMYVSILKEPKKEGEERTEPQYKPEVPVVARFPSTVLQALLSILSSEGWEDLVHPIKGRDIEMRRTGERKQTRYTAVPVANPSKIRVPLETLKELEPLGDAVLALNSSEEEVLDWIEEDVGFDDSEVDSKDAYYGKQDSKEEVDCGHGYDPDNDECMICDKSSNCESTFEETTSDLEDTKAKELDDAYEEDTKELDDAEEDLKRKIPPSRKPLPSRRPLSKGR